MYHAESVYGVFEAKQTINANNVAYAQKKITSVRTLKQTSLPIPHSDGLHPAKDAIRILGGILALESDWKRPFKDKLDTCIKKDQDNGRLDIGCIASHGYFWQDVGDENYRFYFENTPATAFIFRLMSMLQMVGTVPMIDVQAYAKWLNL